MFSRGEHALALAARGLRVFPLIPGTKRPAVKEWQKVATTDPDIIRKVWTQRDYNIGVLMGDGFVGIDVDVKNGKAGLDSYAALGLSDEEQDTFRVRTPSGGFHGYYRASVSGTTAGRLGDGIDTRGDGGFLVGPGSVLTNGSGSGAYEIVSDAPIRDLPERIRTRLADSHPKTNDALRTRNDGLDDEATVQRASLWLRESALLAVERRGGDHTTFVVAAKLKDMGLSEAVAFELMFDHWNDRCSPPWKFHDLQTKVANAFRYGSNPPGIGHPSVAFGDVDIQPPAPKPLPKSPWFRHDTAIVPSDAEWNFFRILPRRGTLVCVGPSQAGKTFLEIELARCLATGKPFFGVEPDDLGGTVFLFAGTEGSGLAIRLAALQEDKALPISARIVGNLAERDALTHLYEAIKDEAERMDVMFGVKLRMVVIETLSASGLLIEESNNGEAARAMANLGQLAQLLDVVVVTTHHPPKEGRGARGASAIPNNADYVWEIYRDGREQTRKLDLTKARDAEQRMIGSFTLVPVVLGQDSRGRDITSMTVSMGEPIIDRPGRKPPKFDTFLRALDFAFVEPETVEGEKCVEYQTLLDEFKDLMKDAVKDRSNIQRVFRRCYEFAQAFGTMEERSVHGVRYVFKREIVE